MSDVGGPISYYLRAITNLDFDGAFIGYWHLLAVFSILSAIFLLFLSYLILRADPKRAKNRFMALMLCTEALRCSTAMLFWVYAWPVEFLQVMEPARVVYYTMSFQLFILYMVAATFYSEKQWAQRVSGFFRLHGLYILPIFSFALIIGVSSLLGGTSVAIGDISWVYCAEVGSGYGTTASGNPLPFEVNCITEFEAVYPMTFSNVALGPLTRVLLFIPLIGAIIAMVSTSNSRKRIMAGNDASLIGEVQAVRLGFIGKTVLQITTTLILFTIIGLLGSAPTISTNIFNQDTNIPRLLIYLAPLMPTAVVLAALFEGLIFTYAVIKNDMFGIDERLRKTFITATFAGLGTIMFLIATELMESIFNQGWIGGVVIGLPLIVLRKPIISVLSNISSTIMPESHTTQELGYLEMYALAIKDGTITENERRMLDLQARSYGIKNERRVYLENWFNDNLVDDENGISNLSEKYGASGINLMSVFSTTGQAPIDEREIIEAFTQMDKNKDNVISREEFSESEEVTKLSMDSQNELFNEIDQNKDGVLQYGEFQTMAQITEAHVLYHQEE